MEESIRLHDEETVKQKLVQRIPSHYQLGAAIGRGDCFFDAMAQSLNAMKGKKEHTAKSLRILCDDYIKSGKHTWVKETIEAEGDNYEQYLVRIPFTIEELAEEEKENTGFKLEDIVWGRAEIEGRIICEIAKVKLHVIGVLEQPINGMDVTEQLVDAQALEPITTIENGPYDRSDIVHLVNYRNHFVPLLDSKKSQIEKPLTQPAEYSLRVQQKWHGVSVPLSLATRAEYVEIIRQKIKEGPAADPNYRMLFEKLVDPAYKEEKDFLKKEISEYRINLQAYSSPIIQNYLTWLQKNIPQNEDNTPRMLFSDEKIDLYIRDQNPNELLGLIQSNDKSQESAIEAITSQEESYKKLKCKLQKKYQEKKFIERLFYPNDPLTIDKIYVNLQIVKEEEQRIKEKMRSKDASSLEITRDHDIHWYETIYTAKNPIKLKNLSQLFNTGEKKRLLIEGRAGIGKTTLCQYIAYCWTLPAEIKKSLWSNEFDFIFWIPLRALKVIDSDIIEVLERICFCNGITSKFTPCEKNILSQLIKEKKILWLLDGYDELFIPNESNLEKLWEALLNEENVIITSRPGYSGSLYNLYRAEVTGFNDKQILKYIQRFYGASYQDEVQITEKVKQLQQFMQIHNSVQGISHVPINLELLCNVYENGQLKILDNITLTELYNELIKNLYERHATQRKGKKAVEITMLADISASEDYAKATLFLECLAFKGMEACKIILKKELLQKAVSLLSQYEKLKCISIDELLVQAKELGLLKTCYDGQYESYYFIHLTFQEYFAARYIARSFIAIKENQNINMPEKDLKAFISATKWKNYYEVMYWFVARLLMGKKGFLKIEAANQKEKMEKVVARQQIFFDWLLEESRHELAIKEITLLIRCLDEADLSEIVQKEAILDSAINWYMSFLNNSDFWLNNNEFLQLENALSLSPKVMKNSKLIDRLLNILKESNNFFTNWLRVKVTRALARLNYSDAQVVKALLLALKEDQYWRTRKEVITTLIALRKLGPEFNEFVIKLLNEDINKENSRDTQAIIRTIKLLGELKHFSPEIAIKAEDLLENKTEEIKSHAAILLAKLNVLKENNLLIITKIFDDIDVIEDEDEILLFIEAAEVLFKFNKITLNELINKLLELVTSIELDKEHIIKISTLLSHFKKLRGEFFKELLKKLELNDDAIILSVMRLFKSFVGSNKEIQIWLFKVLKDNSSLFKIRMKALNIICKINFMTPEIVNNLTLLVCEQDIGLDVADKLCKLDLIKPEGIPVLLKILNNKNKDVYKRLIAAGILFRLNLYGLDEAVTLLLNCLNSQDGNEVQEAIEISVYLKNPTPEIINKLIYLFENKKFMSLKLNLAIALIELRQMKSEIFSYLIEVIEKHHDKYEISIAARALFSTSEGSIYAIKALFEKQQIKILTSIEVKLEIQTLSFFDNESIFNWKKFPETKLVGPYVGHQVRFFTMPETKVIQAKAFSEHLKNVGFEVQIKKAGNSPSLVVDLTASKATLK